MAIKAADQITITDITDAYSVILTSESYTFVGGVSGAASGAKCTTQAVAYCGSNQCNAVNVNVDDIICPEGISATVENSGTAAPTITLALTSTLAAACEVTIPVVVDGITVNKKFSIAVAKTGATGGTGAAGRGIKSTVVEYQAGASNTTPPTGTWNPSVPSVAAGQYLWTKTVFTYTNGTSSDPQYSVARQGANGAKGEDAITISVTSSNGTVFKNNSGSTVLTAHVYKAGVEQAITDAGVVNGIGTVKWYKGTTLAATAKTLTVKASDVTNVQAYTCQIEA